MSMTIWNPFSEMDRVFRKFNDRMNVTFSDRIFAPLTDVKETDDEIIIETNLPGIKKDELEIEATPEGVTIRAEVNGKKEHKKEDKIIRRERYARQYLRRIGFSVPVKATEAKSTLKDGVLTLNFPKAEEYKPVKLIPETN
jgi:HSP20 family protein